MTRTLLNGCALALLATGLQAAQPAPLASGIDQSAIDRSVRPQDDFYRHVNGRWIDTTTIPADRGRFGSFDKLAEDTQEQVRAVIEGLATTRDAADPDQQKIHDLYRSFMDEERLERVGTAPLQPLLARVDAVQSAGQLAALMAQHNRIGLGAPLGGYVGQDAKDATRYILSLGQSGLGLPDRDYYLQDEARLKDIRDQYLAHIERLLTLAGVANARDQAQQVLAIETALARVQWSRVDNRDPVKRYNKFEVGKLPGLTPDFNWQAFLDTFGVGDKASEVIVGQPSYVTAMAELLQQQPLAAWKAYFRWQVVSGLAPYLNKAMVDERFAFTGTTLRGVQENRPRWKRGVTLVDGVIGEGVGKLYVARHFPPESKRRMEQLVANLVEAYRGSIDTLAWMGPETRARAKAKLAKFNTMIAYPDTWRDYSSLAISADDLVGNLLRGEQYDHERNIARLGKPVDRGEWSMTPQTVNAYYSATLNTIVFPAAILQPPFFNAAADDAVNYGGIGAVIGHEISHGFDDQGSQFDGDGNLVGVPGWFTEADIGNFKARTERLVAQYAAIEPVKGFAINGKLTLGENIADTSGLAIAYKAYKLSLGGKPSPVIDGLSGEQRLFYGWAQVWRSKSRENEMVAMLKSDPHAPAFTRGGVPPTNIDAFYEAFGIKPGDGMYRAPEQRVSLW
jgi:predicted metalloendopeptidase